MRRNFKAFVWALSLALLNSTTPVFAICLSPSTYSSDAFKVIGASIDYTICLIGDQARIINQHADILGAVRADLDSLRLDVIDMSNGLQPVAGAQSDTDYLVISNAQKINALETKLDEILDRLSQLESIAR